MHVQAGAHWSMDAITNRHFVACLKQVECGKGFQGSSHPLGRHAVLSYKLCSVV